MKPTGSIPVDFKGPENMLLIGGERADALVDRAGNTPLFVYDADIIRNRISRLRAAMPPQLKIHYAVKANPYPKILSYIGKYIDGFDVASGGELDRVLNTGFIPSDISFAGPGKRDSELEKAIASGITLNVESRAEAERAFAISARLGLRARLAVRVNPDFDLRGSGMRMGGGAKPFGIDAAEVPGVIRAIMASGAEWRGLHIFAGSQALDADAIIETQAATVALAASIAEEIGTEPPLVNLGGGFGIPYFVKEKTLDIRKIGQNLALLIEARPSALHSSAFAIELGRWLVGEAGVYLTRIIDRKISHGEIFLVTDGGLHHQLAASGNFGTVVRRNYPVAIANRFGAKPQETASIVGCLCTPLDRLADQVELPQAQPGDLVAVFMAGAYGATASPQAFLGHEPAIEMLVGTE